MSYDIYCYKSNKEIPDKDEALLFLNLENIPINKDGEEKERIANSLLKSDDKLEYFRINNEEVKIESDYIELSSKDDTIPFQFNIENNSVTISIPYWFDNEDELKEVLNQAKKYLEVIYDTAKYHTCDPQTEEVCLARDFDIEKTKQKYLEGVTFLQTRVSSKPKRGLKEIFEIIGKILIISTIINIAIFLFNRILK